jgi:hypothetical protein
MIRRVAFGKAIAAGVAGAVAWEAVACSLKVAGLPVFDLVKVLGTTVFRSDAEAALWWPAGMLLHCSVGAIWAIFYAYFFWSVFDRRPVIQGLMFSLLPAFLAGVVMVPQMSLMQAEPHNEFGLFAVTLGFWGPAMILLGHLVYGAVLGSRYVRPVGYRTGRRIDLRA